MIFTPSEVRAYYAVRVPSLKITNHREWRGPCPVHSGKDPNFAVNAETGLAQCHSQCRRGWDVISLEMELSGLDFPRAKERVFELVGRPRVPWEERDVEAIYDYADESGKLLLYQVLWRHGKKFSQRRPDGSGGWVSGLGDVRRVPFHLPKMLNADFVAVCEGEKDCNTLDRLGLAATCNNSGAGNFKPELARYFSNNYVAIFPDNDEPGRDHALKVAALLAPVAKSVKIIELPGLPARGDVTDFVNAGGTVDQIRELYRKAQPWTPEWEFAVNVPDESDKYVRTIEQEVEAAGGLTAFWDLAKVTGLPTPFPKLNQILSGGLRNGEVYVIGANQGAGKTSLALQFGLAALRKGFGVLIFSMEMGWRAVFQRMAAIEARIDLAAFRESQRKHLDCAEDRIRLSRATGEIGIWRLQVSTKPAITPEYVVLETKRLAKRSPVDLVICDHMQLMGADQGTRTEYEKFTAISRAMKQTAVEVGVSVLLVSQTSRSNSRERRSELEVSDLRGSGAIEEDGAGVFLLFEDREDADSARSIDEGRRYTKGPVRCFLKVGKNRYGEQGRCLSLLHYKAQTRFDVPETEAVNEE
jgi:KaiC/GvpD/RAD55 family RecA-like ATPase